MQVHRHWSLLSWSTCICDVDTMLSPRHDLIPGILEVNNCREAVRGGNVPFDLQQHNDFSDE